MKQKRESLRWKENGSKLKHRDSERNEIHRKGKYMGKCK